jgi:hypothetical protein
VLAAGLYYLFNLKQLLTPITQVHYSFVLSVRNEIVRYGIITRLKPDAGVFMQVNSPTHMKKLTKSFFSALKLAKRVVGLASFVSVFWQK